MAEIDWLQLHKDRKDYLSELNSRRDTDRELSTSYKYVMKDADDVEISDIISFTHNRLMVFKAYVEAALNKADERVVVESNDPKIDTSIIERAIEAMFRSANERLMKRGGWRIEPYFDQQACMRGETASRQIFQMLSGEDGEYLDTNITTWDTRFVTYETGENGLAWAAYEIEKTRANIMSEQWAIEKNYEPPAKVSEVVDLWTPEENIIYVGGAEVFRQPHMYGEPPICVQKVPIGSMFADKDTIQYQCESIFFLVRDIIDEFNRCMSILQTLNLKATKAALQQPVEKTGDKPSEYDDVASMGSVVGQEGKLGPISMVPYGGAKQEMILALNNLKEALDDGTLARIMLGDLPGEMSAVALVQVEQGQGQVYMPRLGTRGLQKQQIAYQAIRQILNLGVSTIELGDRGHKETFNVKDLEGEYSITFKYANKSPETDFARLSMARQYKESELLDDLTILDDVMKRDDPKGDKRNMDRQNLRKLSPILQKYDGLMALAEAAELGDEDAQTELVLAEAEFGVTFDEMMAGNIPQVEQPKKGTASQPAPLISGERSSPQKAANLLRTAGEGEE